MVAPKKAALFEAESELQAQMNTLNAKRAQLQAVLDKLQVCIMSDKMLTTQLTQLVKYWIYNLCVVRLNPAQKKY